MNMGEGDEITRGGGGWVLCKPAQVNGEISLYSLIIKMCIRAPEDLCCCICSVFGGTNIKHW